MEVISSAALSIYNYCRRLGGSSLSIAGLIKSASRRCAAAWYSSAPSFRELYTQPIVFLFKLSSPSQTKVCSSLPSPLLIPSVAVVTCCKHTSGLDICFNQYLVYREAAEAHSSVAAGYRTSGGAAHWCGNLIVESDRHHFVLWVCCNVLDPR